MAGDRPDQADYQKCGAGEGALCCAYLAVGNGPECCRSTPGQPLIEAAVAAGRYTAVAMPQRPFPQCQTERTEMPA